jgi:hypothetical protein
MRLACAVIASMLLWAPPTWPQSHMDKALFLDLSAEPDSTSWGLLLVHLKGVLAGLEAANMALARRGDEPLHCPPPDAAITPAWAAREMRAYLAKYPKIPDEMSIAVIARHTLADSFPCESGA